MSKYWLTHFSSYNTCLLGFRSSQCENLLFSLCFVAFIIFFIILPILSARFRYVLINLRFWNFTHLFRWFWLGSPRSCFFKFLSLFSRRCSFVSNHILLILQLFEVRFWCGFRQSLSHQERNEMASYIIITRMIVFRPLAVECSSLVKTRKLQSVT